jgi:hypothetical protein
MVTASFQDDEVRDYPQNITILFHTYMVALGRYSLLEDYSHGV